MLLQCWVVLAVKLALMQGTSEVWLLGSVHSWAPLQGFQVHPLVKRAYQTEEVGPW